MIAASRCMDAVAWLYRSSVVATVAWPSISLTSFGWTPWLSISVAVVWRASWGFDADVDMSRVTAQVAAASTAPATRLEAM